MTRVRSCDLCDVFVPFSTLKEVSISETESLFVCKDRLNCQSRV